jgi:glycosyltransferase involved in cell wall biosynthesis
MPNALVYSPGFDGHRQVYVFVIVHVLKELGYKINIATNENQILTNSFYIETIKKDPEIRIINTGSYPKGGLDITFQDFIGLQNECKSNLTVFAEADHHFSLFISQLFNKKKKFIGRTVGIFMRPFYYYRKSGVLDKLRFLKHFPSRWRNDEQLSYGLFLSKFSSLDVALCIDEYFVARHQSFTWLPDVFQQFADLIVKNEKSDQRVWIEKLKKFKEKNQDRFLFFYFGTAQFRRGYDILLKMAIDNEGCFIHCGLRNDDKKYIYDVNSLRLSLMQKGCLFETDEYIEDPICIEYFFRSVSHLVLPYRNYFGSSGVMLQALEFGIPVLAPKNGIIGHRIKNFGLGFTYDGNDNSSLKNQFATFRNQDFKNFEEDIRTYMNFQTTDQLKKVLISTFTGNSQPVLQPYF